MKRLLFLCYIMLVMAACGGSPENAATELVVVEDEESICEEMVDTALASLDTVCQAVGRNQACYGNTLVESTLRDDASARFDAPGDIIDINLIQSMTLSSLDVASGEWGFALMQVQADLPDTLPGQNVTFLLFGGTQLTPQGTVDGLQAFYVRTGVGNVAPCNAAPEDGLIIQTPESDLAVHFSLNGVEFELGSTAYIQTEPDAEMVVNLIEGQAVVSAEGTSQTVPAGTRTRVSLDENGIADSAPSEPEPYDTNTTRSLPLRPLVRSIVAAPPAEAPRTTSEQGSALLSTLDNPERGLVEGEISAVGEEDVYELDLGAGQILFIDGNDVGVDGIWYTIVAPDETRLVNWTLENDNRRLEIEASGTYILTVLGNDDAVGAYSFRLWDVPRDSIAPASISDSTATEYEGELRVVGENHVYEIALEAGQILFIDGTDVGADGIWYSIVAPDETRVVNWTLENDNRRLEIEETGTYRLTVYGIDDSVGEYAFRLWGVPENTLDSASVTESDATEYEGELLIPGQYHVYEIALEAQQIIFIDGVDVGADGIWYSIVAPDETRVVNWTLENDNRRLEIEATGTYRLTVYGIDDSVGDYAFRLWAVPADTVTSLEITESEATEVDNELLIPGEQHVYELALEEGQIIFIDGKNVGVSGIWYTITAPDATQIVNWTLENDNRRLEIEETGMYLLTVRGNDDAIGVYAFSIWGLPQTEAIETELSDEVNGELTLPGEIHSYVYDLQAGQSLLYEAIDTETSDIRWQLLAPDGTVAATSFFANQDTDITLPEQSGEYILEVYANEDAVGAYAFRLLSQ